MARTKTSERARIAAKRGQFPITTAEQMAGIADWQPDIADVAVMQIAPPSEDEEADDDEASAGEEGQAEVFQLPPSGLDVAAYGQEWTVHPWLESARAIRLTERLDQLLAKCNAEVAAKRAAGMKKVAFRPAYNRAVMQLNQDAASWTAADIAAFHQQDHEEGLGRLWSSAEVASSLLEFQEAIAWHARRWWLSIQSSKELSASRDDRDPASMRQLGAALHALDRSVGLLTDMEILETLTAVCRGPSVRMSQEELDLLRHNLECAESATTAWEKKARKRKAKMLLLEEQLEMVCHTAKSSPPDPEPPICVMMEEGTVQPMERTAAAADLPRTQPPAFRSATEALDFATELRYVSRPPGGSGMRVQFPQEGRLSNYSTADLRLVFPDEADTSGVYLDPLTLRNCVIRVKLICSDTTMHSYVQEDGFFFESPSRFSTEQMQIIRQRSFFLKVASLLMIARLSEDGGIRWDPAAIAYLLREAEYSRVNFASSRIPTHFMGWSFIQRCPLCRSDPRGIALREHMLAGRFGRDGCHLLAFSENVIFRSVNDILDALRGVGHAFSLFYGDSPDMYSWSEVLGMGVNLLIMDAGALRTPEYLSFALDLALQKWGLAVARTTTYHGIPICWTSQLAAKNFLVHAIDDIPMSALDEHNFEAVLRVSVAIPTASPVRVSVPTYAPPAGVSGAVTDTAGPCFFALSHVLGVSKVPCGRHTCTFKHLSLQEIVDQRQTLTPLLQARPELLKAIESL